MKAFILTVLMAMSVPAVGDPQVDMAQAQERYRKLAPMFEAAADKHGVPRHLLAMVYVESRVRNLPEKANHRRCAGLWQLDRRTARSLGLTVTKGRDDRLDPKLATDAALRYLKELHGDFGNWDAAVVAYNIGETKLRRIMRERGEKDPWKLVHDKRVGRFLVRVASATAVMAPVDRGILVSAAHSRPGRG